MRPPTSFALLMLVLAAFAKAQTTAPAQTAEKSDESVVIAPFGAPRLPTNGEPRTFQLSKINKLQAYETSRELQRLFSLFVTQNITDATPTGFSKAPGPLTQLTYVIQQDLGDNRYVVKANWPAGGPGDLLAAGTESLAILLLDKPAVVGATGRCAAVHVGKAAVTLTAQFPPLLNKRLTLRREAFVECTPLDDNAAGLNRFLEAIRGGAEISVLSPERVTCKACGGLGFTREAQKGKLEDKRIPCAQCEGGKALVVFEVRFVP